jgi:hypothetical protein
VTVVATDVERPAGSAAPRSDATRERLFEPGGPTLEDVVLGAWDELVADGRAECPVCGSAMSLLTGCEGCGAELS